MRQNFHGAAYGHIHEPISTQVVDVENDDVEGHAYNAPEKQFDALYKVFCIISQTLIVTYE